MRSLISGIEVNKILLIQRQDNQTIAVIATTDEALSASAALVAAAAAAAAEIGFIAGCHKYHVRLGLINKRKESITSI